ncbi:hypothetical protein TNIN_380381 [Trichonephila inaurata madagascariensis]|uniref:C2H2-type domain-containing protein n=1 Tax=Trichonephila inaurata madagascariensis TaxID=2747483 RepID=A0A8X6X3V7_9ARAC|nr:hypothetical protein TNIN_380381 [Trichonephila inaurata madagascariensis]
MDESTGEYHCDSCNLQFKAFKQFLSHKYLKHDVSELQPEIHNDDGVSQNASNHFKSSCEKPVSRIPGKNQLKNNNNDRKKGNISGTHFDFSDHSTTQFHHDAFTENTVLTFSSKNVTGCNQEPRSRCHSNPKANANELTLSMKNIQNESCRLQRNPAVNKSQPSMSSECKPMEIYSHWMDEQNNRNQKPTSEHSQIQFRGHEMNQQYNVNQSYTLSGIKRKVKSIHMLTEVFLQSHLNSAQFSLIFVK